MTRFKVPANRQKPIRKSSSKTRRESKAIWKTLQAKSPMISARITRDL